MRPLPSRGLELLLGVLTAFGSLSIDMYLPALPTIGRELGGDPAAAQVTVAAYFVGLAVGQLTIGPLLDRFGRRRPLLAGLALYALGSIGCALAPTLGALVVCRFLQAFGGAAGLVVPRTIVRDFHSGAEAARMLSRLMLIMGAAPIFAPLLGGAVLAVAGWRVIFGGLAALAVTTLAVAWVALPETAPPRVAGATARNGAAALLRDPRFVGHALVVAFAQAGLFAYIAGSPFVLITLHGVPPEHYGWFFGANGAGLIAVSQLNRLLLRHAAPARILRAGLSVAVLAAVGLVVVAETGAGGLPALAAALWVFVSSLGVVNPNGTVLALERHGSRAGLASALLGAGQFAIAASVASLVTAAHDGTARPMALGVAIPVGVAAVTLATSAWITRRRAAEADERAAGADAPEPMTAAPRTPAPVG